MARHHWFISLLMIASNVMGAAVSAQSIQFFGTGSGDIDRVKIRIDDPTNANPGPPADVGAGDFTIEFWLKSANNSAGPIACGNNIGWINGNIVFDRDRFNQGRAFGISLTNGRIAFGIRTSSDQQRTICAATPDLRDGAWHHVAVQRAFASGELTIYVDGRREALGSMPPNEDLSYPDDGVSGNFCGSGGNQPCTNSDPFIVLGAEKHDAGSQYPSFSGWLDELRLSTVVRYQSNFTPAQRPFAMDNDTAALYHFDEPSGIAVLDENSNASPGEMRVFANMPRRSADTPFGATPAAGALEFLAAEYTFAENAGNASVIVVRVGGSAGSVSANWSTFPGSATAGSDYTHSMGMVSWSDGDAAPKTIAVPLLDDAVFEGEETFGVALTNVTGGASLGVRATAAVRLRDDESPPAPGVLQLSSGVLSVGEGTGEATITVRRSGGADGNVQVSYATANGTASAGADFAATSGTLSWGNGDSGEKSFTIAIVDDALVEGPETLTVALANPTGGAVLGAPSALQLSIVDNDAPSAGRGGGGCLDFLTLAALSLGVARRSRKRRKNCLFRNVSGLCSSVAVVDEQSGGDGEDAVGAAV
jgi:hypothetical protein